MLLPYVSRWSFSLLCISFTVCRVEAFAAGTLFGSCSLRVAHNLSFWSITSTEMHFEWRMSCFVGCNNNLGVERSSQSLLSKYLVRYNG